MLALKKSKIYLKQKMMRFNHANMIYLSHFYFWAYSSAVEPPAHNRLVPGSNPGGPTT